MRTLLVFLSVVLTVLTSCSNTKPSTENLIHHSYPEAQAELEEVVRSLAEDLQNANIKGLEAGHLDSDKFTKFGPRNFERQDVTSTNRTESTFFSALSNLKYEIRDLKVDVFDNVGVVTYYPYVTFERDGKLISINGRQTLVYVNTDDGWKIAHEHGTIR